MCCLDSHTRNASKYLIGCTAADLSFCTVHIDRPEKTDYNFPYESFISMKNFVGENVSYGYSCVSHWKIGEILLALS